MLKIVPAPVENEVFESFGTTIYRHARANPSRPAVITDDRTVTWGTFGEMVSKVAGKLVAEGVGRGSYVAILAENSPENLVTFCAILAAGGCAVPLPGSGSEPALQGMVKDSGSRILFASPAQMGMARTLGAERVIDILGVLDWSRDAAPLLQPVDVAPDDLFNIIYSSGTTGQPKGIVHDYRIRARQLNRFKAFGLTSESRFMISTPIYSNGTLFGVLPTLAIGGALVVMSKFTTADFLRMSEAHRVTHAVMVPVQLMRLMAEPSFGDYDLSSYQCKFSLSAPLSAKLIGEIMDRWPGNLIEIYGLTEGGVSTVLDCKQYPEKWDSVGKASAGVEIRVIDENSRELPSGSFGELVGRAPPMMSYYHNQPEKTAEILWQDEQGNHFIRSGDLGRVDEDGFVYLSDRKKDMILSGGFNIYAADLEAVLNSHPSVAESAVIAVPSEAWGETPLGIVVLSDGAQDTARAICDWANVRLGKTQRLSEVLVTAEMPRSDIGKILKKELRTLHAVAR